MKYRQIDEGLKKVKDAEDRAEQVKEEFGDPSPEYRDALKLIDKIRAKFFSNADD